jgi:hypothetical protein
VAEHVAELSIATSLPPLLSPGSMARMRHPGRVRTSKRFLRFRAKTPTECIPPLRQLATHLRSRLGKRTGESARGHSAQEIVRVMPGGRVSSTVGPWPAFAIELHADDSALAAIDRQDSVRGSCGSLHVLGIAERHLLAFLAFFFSVGISRSWAACLTFFDAADAVPDVRFRQST